jgi:hypothetical protein
MLRRFLAFLKRFRPPVPEGEMTEEEQWWQAIK